MAEPARAAEPTLPADSRTTKPVPTRMTIVMPAIEDPGVAADQRFGQAVLRGTLVAFVLLFVLMTGGALIAGLGLPGALGVGVFCAVMDSLGWGGMMGVTVIASREMKAAQSAANERARSAGIE